jgi:hypothetical protein
MVVSCLIDGGVGLLIILLLPIIFIIGLASMLGVMHTTIKSCEGVSNMGKKILKSNKHGECVTWGNGISFCKCEWGFLIRSI